jgi:dihydropyrimidinase
VKLTPIKMSNSLLIEHACVVNFDSIQDDVSIYIENGIIKFIGSNFTAPADCRIIDANGRYVLPGGIDPHTHFEFEWNNTVTIDDFYHGTLAGVAGGTTTIIDFIVPNKGQSPINAYNKWRSKADKKVVCDFGLVRFSKYIILSFLKNICLNSIVQ